MAINKTVNGGNTTVTLSYTATTEKVDSTLTDAAKYLYDKTGGHGVELAEDETVDDLTTAEIGAIIDNYVKTIILNAAKVYNSQKAQETARATAETEATTKYIV